MKSKYEEAISGSAKLVEDLSRLKKVQELIVDDILSLKATTATYVGNDYRDYAQAVQSISDKYNGKSEWGCLQTGTIVDLRAAFILGDGAQVYSKTDAKAEAEEEIEWCNDFFEYNGLDEEMSQEMAKEAEIEGKVAIRLFWDDLSKEPWRGHKGMVSARYVSWLSKKYTVKANPEDYLDYILLSWPATGTSPAGNVPPEEFVYKKFGGRINDPNEAQPKIMKCLTQVDRLDRALRDLREINHLFSSPTPDFKCETPQQATTLLEHLRATNWKIGKAIAHVGDFSMKSPDASGIQSLIAEIELNTKMISGTTGIPIHYLGLLDLLRNRATGDNTRELVMAATTRERSIWVSVYEEMIEKAMIMYNEKIGLSQKSTRLDPEAIGVEIPLISQDHWTNLERVLIPAALGGIISKEFVAGQIPGVDLEDEAEKREEAEAKEMEQAQIEVDRIRAATANQNQQQQNGKQSPPQNGKQIPPREN
jgi:hypothetical protein